MQLAPDLPAVNYCVIRRVSVSVDMECINFHTPLLIEVCEEETVPHRLANLNLV